MNVQILHIGFICGIVYNIIWSKSVFQNYTQKKIRCIDVIQKRHRKIDVGIHQ